ncbi:hypothetical protein FQN54_009691 [Arachnomyces sp. PD_36]|nr:hypothetical protein FQN54_009691 [Arachnomyces sp. PD_36]
MVFVGVLQSLKKAGNWLAPPPPKSADGRDQWPSRAAFLLAAMGGCAGQGNLLRYPSVVYNNYGVQWFIPYMIAVVIVAIPALILEISIGQAYRGGTVIAMNNINRRLKGVGMGPVLVSFIVTQYFTVNLAWIMRYFRSSFTSPLPWEGRINEFYMGDVIHNVDPIVGKLSEDGTSVLAYSQYPSANLIGETVGWSVFIWFLVWVSIFRGVGLTGRVVYWTMGLPIVTTIILVGRSVSLENAGEGVKMLWGTWRGEQLASGSVWQTAVGQVFFSTGIGFGYFTTYASYNAKHSNAVMDAFLICGSNVLFENFAAFSVFGVVGYLGMFPKPGDPELGAFTVGFLTLPEAVLHMPGANFWAVLLFFTLVVLGFSSAFVMLDAVATLAIDAGLKFSRPVIVTTLTLISFLMCLPYCTELGYHLLTGIDNWINNIVLIFVVWSEVVGATVVYRWTDVVSQTGNLGFIVYNVGYLGGQIAGVSAAHGAENPAIGAGAGFAVYIICTVVSIFLAKTPEIPAPSFWSRNAFLTRFWYLAFYSGNQLRRDLNLVVGGKGNWRIPPFWPVLLRYITAPILAIILSFSFPEFHTLRYDPLMIAGFVLAIICLCVILLGFIMPRYYQVFIPPNRRGEGLEETVPNELKEQKVLVATQPDADLSTDADSGEAGLSSSSREMKEEKA